MSIKFNPVQRTNPRDLTAPKQYYASLDRGDDLLPIAGSRDL